MARVYVRFDGQARCYTCIRTIEPETVNVPTHGLPALPADLSDRALRRLRNMVDPDLR